MQLAKRRSVDKPVKKCPSHLLKRGHKLDAGSQPVPTRVLMENQQSEHIRTIEMNSDELMWSLTTWPTWLYGHTWPSNVWEAARVQMWDVLEEAQGRIMLGSFILGHMEPAQLVRCWSVADAFSGGEPAPISLKRAATDLLPGLLDSFKDKSAWTYILLHDLHDVPLYLKPSVVGWQLCN